MSKLDQLKALGDAKRGARSVSTTKGGASQKANPPLPNTVMRDEIGSNVLGRKAANGERPSAESSGPTNSKAQAIIKRGRGRPKIEGPREWDLAGVSKSTWHRQRRAGK